jgi:S-adenosylmethionine decarboxylase
MVSESPSENQTIVSLVSAEPAKDYFVERDGVKFAGMHLLIDIWGATNLDSPELIDRTLCAGALEAGATILHSHFHHFTPNAGVSGVVVLAESHISIHTWPERGFAALDVFMCGCCDPYKVIPFLQAAFSPTEIQVDEQKRGIVT